MLLVGIIVICPGKFFIYLIPVAALNRPCGKKVVIVAFGLAVSLEIAVFKH